MKGRHTLYSFLVHSDVGKLYEGIDRGNIGRRAGRIDGDCSAMRWIEVVLGSTLLYSATFACPGFPLFKRSERGGARNCYWYWEEQEKKLMREERERGKGVPRHRYTFWRGSKPPDDNV